MTTVYLSNLNVANVFFPTPVEEFTTTWQWAVGDWRGEPQRELVSISGRKLTCKLKDPDEASFSLLGDSDDPLYIDELISDLWVSRNGVKLFRGRIADSTHSISESSYGISYTASDYRSMLEERLIITATDADPELFFLEMTPEAIIWELITHAQSLPGMNLGISKGSWPASGIPPLADESFKDGDTIWSAIYRYIDATPGVDFYIDPDMKANIYLQRGSNRAVVLDYGGTIDSVTRTFSKGSFHNFIRQSGSDDFDRVIRPVEYNIGSYSEGGWMGYYPDTTLESQESIVAKADYNYNQASSLRPSYSLSFVPGTWKGPEHVWVGDTVKVVVKRGKLAVNELMRVLEISIDIDQNGQENVSVVVNRPNNPKDKLRKFVENVRYLNKR